MWTGRLRTGFREKGGSEAVIELFGVTRTYPGEGGEDGGVVALDDVSLGIGRGEFVCFTGPSGCGKTTLLNVMGCLDRPSAGEYRLAGVDTAGLDDDGLAALRRGSVGFVFQSFNLVEYLTARENVALPAGYASGRRAESKERADSLLGSLGLDGRSGHRPGELSGGEQQRVALARALMNGAGVILCDEPTAALDAGHSEEVLGLLEKLVQDGRTVVVASHKADVAARARRRVEMREGRVVSDTGSGEAGGGVAAPAAGVDSRTPWLSATRGGLLALRSGGVRAALMVFGILLEVWSVASLLGLAEGAAKEAASIMERVGANRLRVTGMAVDESVVVARLLPKTLEDAKAIEREIDNVKEARPSNARYLTVRSDMAALEGVTVTATEATQARTPSQNLPWAVERGRFLLPQDGEELAQVAVVGPALADKLFGPGVDPIGRQIEMEGLAFVVAGVLAPHPKLIGEGEFFATDRESADEKGLPHYAIALGLDVFVPFRTGSEMLFPGQDLTGLEVFVEDVSRLDETAQAIKDLMFKRQGRGGYQVQYNAAALAARTKLSGTLVAVFVSLGVAALLAGGLGIMSVTLAAIDQRRREIGIRMAVGARRRDVSAQFLVETLVVAFLGGVLGILLSLATGPLVSALTSAPVAFEPWFFLAAVGCAVLTGLVFGIMPARRAAGLDPAQALRLE